MPGPRKPSTAPGRLPATFGAFIRKRPALDEAHESFDRDQAEREHR
jgi:hypothetical protein